MIILRRLAIFTLVFIVPMAVILTLVAAFSVSIWYARLLELLVGSAGVFLFLLLAKPDRSR